MKVPFLDLKAQYELIRDEIVDGLQEVLDNTAFAGGPFVEKFEKDFGPFCQCKFAIGVDSGTAALWMALLALGMGPGDEVIVPVNTFIATAEAVSFTGAVPVFVDCDEYYNVDVNKIAAAIQKAEDRRQNSERRIQAIIPVHLYGQPANMDAVMTLAEEYGLAVVEDACQAHGAEYKGRRAGSIGDAGCFSFYPGKNLGAYGEAGAIVTNNAELAAKLRMFRDHGQWKKYYHSIIGWNARMDGFQGAVLATKAKYIEGWTRKRQENARLYDELLSQIEGVEIPKQLDGVSAVYHLYVIQVDDRDGLQEYLHKNDIGTGLHYPVPLHLQEAYKHLGYKEGDFTIAERAAKRILSLPMYPELTEIQICYVCDKIKEYLHRS